VDLSRALATAEQAQSAPAVVLCHTVKGKGIPYVEGNNTRSNHGLTAAQYDEAFAHLAALEAGLERGAAGNGGEE
jgi:hypothetical protein